MGESFLRAQTRKFLGYAVNHLTRELDASAMRRPTVVFAPHQDDETLGCGGTIIKKKRLGGDVSIVFLTDGSRSHDLIPAQELKSIRVKEALAASQLLGVAEGDVTFLEFEDGKLGEHLASATDRVKKVLRERRFEQIFIPYSKDDDPSLDHLATNRIVVSALKALKSNAEIYEYPIWFWRHWPWTNMSTRRPRRAWRVLHRGFTSGASLLKDFRCSVYIGDVLELKRDALDQHKSQMTRLIPDARWGTLGDVSNGEFLECFFQQREVFHRHILD